jgi:hypothetical protein
MHLIIGYTCCARTSSFSVNMMVITPISERRAAGHRTPAQHAANFVHNQGTEGEKNRVALATVGKLSVMPAGNDGGQAHVNVEADGFMAGAPVGTAMADAVATRARTMNASFILFRGLKSLRRLASACSQL